MTQDEREKVRMVRGAHAGLQVRCRGGREATIAAGLTRQAALASIAVSRRSSATGGGVHGAS
jgi:hypothetical protein